MTTTNTRRPGRPSGLQGTELLATARALFLRRGFDRTTMNDVAVKAGISKSSLYREHESKDALFVAVVADWTQRGRDSMRPFLDELRETPDIELGLQEFATVLLTALLSPEVADMRRLVAAEAKRFPHVAELYLQTSWHANIAALADTLSITAEQGRLAIDDAYIAAEQLVWLTVGPSLNALTIAGQHHDTQNSPCVRPAVRTFIAQYGT